jgi:hypothetical protein
LNSRRREMPRIEAAILMTTEVAPRKKKSYKKLPRRSLNHLRKRSRNLLKMKTTRTRTVMMLN